MRVLGIDPGLTRCGLGVVDGTPGRPPTLVGVGVTRTPATLETARRLVTVAIDDAATAAERQTAYRRARRELDGLIVLPDATVSSLEEKVAGAIGQRPEPTLP